MNDNKLLSAGANKKEDWGTSIRMKADKEKNAQSFSRLLFSMFIYYTFSKQPPQSHRRKEKGGKWRDVVQRDTRGLIGERRVVSSVP